MKYLVGDIGNTLTKMTLTSHNFKIKKSISFETKKLHRKKFLEKILKRLPISQLHRKILFSSVVPTIYKNLKKFLKKKGFKVFEIKELKIKTILKIKINNFNQVGSDRLANAIGSYDIYKKNCLVIDFGTATTFDVVKKPWIYDGGVIAPGINLSILNLSNSTEMLPFLKLSSKARAYGKNTTQAMNSGFIWGYQGLINNIIGKIISSNKLKYKIILTGGYASLFKKYIKKKTIIDQNVTIKGVIKVYKEFLI
tara:strand:- start:1257 stop:2015 length:759 start_codon:yes stop_codon:yes gene_type:complete